MLWRLIGGVDFFDPWGSSGIHLRSRVWTTGLIVALLPTRPTSYLREVLTHGCGRHIVWLHGWSCAGSGVGTMQCQPSMGASTSAPSTTPIALTTTHRCWCHWFLCLRTLLRHCSGIALLLFCLEVLFNLSCSFNHIIQGLGLSLKACNASANFWSQLREEVLDPVHFCIGFEQVFDRLQICCKSANILACPLFR